MDHLAILDTLDLVRGYTIEEARNQLSVGSWIKLQDGQLACVTQSDRLFTIASVRPKSGDVQPVFVRLLNSEIGSHFTPTVCSSNIMCEALLYADASSYRQEIQGHLARCVPV